MLPAAFLLDGRPVTLVRPAARRPAARGPGARTASGSFAVAGAPARVARASRIWVEGVHDAALRRTDLGRRPARRGRRGRTARRHRRPGRARARRSARPASGGSACSSTTSWPAARRRASSPSVPRTPTRARHRPPLRRRLAGGEADRARHRRVADGAARHRLEDGICAALGVSDPREMWRRVLAGVDSYADVEVPLLRAVEELIDFVTGLSTALAPSSAVPRWGYARLAGLADRGRRARRRRDAVARPSS